MLSLNQLLLDSIKNRDWSTYDKLTEKEFSCIEPETDNLYYEGKNFHKTYFDNPIESYKDINITESMVNPVVKIYSDICVLCYTRLIQISTKTGVDVKRLAETRIWRKQGAEWKLNHYHKS